jgi:DNA replicative helicase MCM subunit Mcm2 (Cdc46/Mcm family)
VTKVNDLDDLLIAVLLTFCSALRFQFNGEFIRGWLSTVIIGDSGTAKTQTYLSISDFIGVGDMFSALTGSRTGLAYAMVDQKDKGWNIKVGKFPKNSRRILCVDEAQQLPTEDIHTIG